jgi:hypothetical protein
MAQDTDTPRLRGVPLAPSAPFQKFGPLVFCHHASHVQQPLIFQRVSQGAIEKDHLHASLRSFLEQHDLIGVMAREALGTMHVEAIDAASRSDIASALQRWAHE